MFLITANEATAAQRRVYFHLVDATDFGTPETGEAAGQPQISTNGGAWTNTGIGTLSAIGNGRYYADLTQTAVATVGDRIETRYKSANTAECPGDSVMVIAPDLYDAASLGLSRLDAAISSRMATFTLPTNFSSFTLDASGRVQVQSGTSTGQISLSSGLVTAGTVSDKTGYSLSGTQTFNVTGNVTGNLSGSVGSVTGAVGSVTGNVGGNVTGSVGSVASFGTLVADVATAVWAAGTRTLSSFGTLAADVWASVTRTLTGSVTVGTNNDKTGYSLATTPPTAVDIADAVWDEATSGHQTTGTTGKALTNAGSGGATIYGESGSVTFTYTVYDTNGTTPLPGVAVWVSADIAGTQRSQTKITDALGRVVFDLDPATVYFWRSYPTRTFSNPDSEVVS